MSGQDVDKGQKLVIEITDAMSEFAKNRLGLSNARRFSVSLLTRLREHFNIHGVLQVSQYPSAHGIPRYQIYITDDMIAEALAYNSWDQLTIQIERQGQVFTISANEPGYLQAGPSSSAAVPSSLLAVD